MSSLIPPDKIGEAIVSALVISAAVLKYFSDKGAEKTEKEEEVLPEESEAEVITKKEFNLLLVKLEEANSIAAKERDTFADTLACISIITILLQVLASDRRKLLLKTAEQQIFAFLRHAEFPSRTSITATLEIAIAEINAEIDDDGKVTKE